MSKKPFKAPVWSIGIALPKMVVGMVRLRIKAGRDKNMNNLQMVRQVEEAEVADRRQLANIGACKQASGSATKRLRMR